MVAELLDVQVVLRNNVGFIGNWSSFEGKAGLLGRDGVHPTQEGESELVFRNTLDNVAPLKRKIITEETRTL
ncbi:hypothetical protein QTP86_017530, partial [Hemibagrus guttatus]